MKGLKSNIKVVDFEASRQLNELTDFQNKYPVTVQQGYPTLFRIVDSENTKPSIRYYTGNRDTRALRRCIEQFSMNTRFFLIVENKQKLLNPILSRFCEIYFHEYIQPENGEIMNLHQYHIQQKNNAHYLNHIKDVHETKLVERMKVFF